MNFLSGACPTIYGPVASRRQGSSLGINLGNPERKICTWGCVYCQCGNGERSRPDPVASGFPSAEAILTQLKQRLRELRPAPDTLTLAGNCEPTTHPEFGAIARELRKLKLAARASWLVTCYTNGTELDDPRVASACNLLDETWVKLDCALSDRFHRLNRPIPGMGSVPEQLARIRKLRAPRIQTLVWTHADARLSNWDEAGREALLEAYLEVSPVDLHLTSVARDTALRGIEPVPPAELEAFAARLRERGLPAKAFS